MEDVRDWILKKLLDGYDRVHKIANDTGFPFSEVENAAKYISRDKNCITMTDTNDGIVIHLKDNYKLEIESFLEQGGYSREEYLKPVTDAERLGMLNLIHSTKNDELFFSNELINYEYSRKRKVLESLLALRFIKISESEKEDIIGYWIPKRGLRYLLKGKGKDEEWYDHPLTKRLLDIITGIIIGIVVGYFTWKFKWNH